ncbi:hypothetical protein [Amycolatopsis sp. cmx-4-83]|uniref:hypothetical protein n=1 Tax=Amycolatopsis sp. cmx-4-83 TaxID=2790940 RepID=UPI00397E2079
MIVALVITVFALVLTDLWLVMSVAVTAVLSRSANRRLRWTTGDHVEDVRNRSSLFAQLSMMGMVNTVAGAFAGLGASMYVVNSKVQFTWSIVPVFLLGIALVLVQGGGLVVGYWASRPLRAWITSPFVLEATVRKQLQAGPAPAEVIDDYDQILAELRRRPLVRGLTTSDGRVRPGMRSPVAEEEWPPARDHDPVGWTGRVRDDLDRRAAWRWVWHGQRRAFVLPLGIGVVLSGTAIGLSAAQLNPGAPTTVALAVAFGLWHVFLCWLGSKAARVELVLINRQHALVLAKLTVCADLIKALRELNRPVHPVAAEPVLPVLSVGRWQLFRRPHR